MGYELGHVGDEGGRGGEEGCEFDYGGGGEDGGAHFRFEVVEVDAIAEWQQVVNKRLVLGGGHEGLVVLDGCPVWGLVREIDGGRVGC